MRFDQRSKIFAVRVEIRSVLGQAIRYGNFTTLTDFTSLPRTFTVHSVVLGDVRNGVMCKQLHGRVGG